ncbi:Est-6 [Trypoxylus dichotomus]
MVSTLFPLLFFLLAASVNCEDPRLLVSIDDGPIRGTYRQSRDGRTFLAFEGIPYAEPPVGSLRFEDPQPIKPWTDILDATAPSICLQTFGTPMGQEDCLYLNVYVPREEINPEENLDVIVHIHGGAFEIGSPGYMAAPGLIMDRDVVYVTMSYRLGIFGFYSTGNGVSNGNFGLKDQALSLKWIQNNIRNFGGNKDSVTITGLSAGSASVHLHYFSPLSKGLFHRGFAQSGTALDPWAVRRDPSINGRFIADAVGCPWEDIECLKEIPAEELLTLAGQTGSTSISFGPTLEPESPTSFLSELPRSQVDADQVLDVPLLLSVVTEDGTVVCEWLDGLFDFLDENWNVIMPLVLEYYNNPRQDEISQKIRDFYLQDRPVTAETFGQVLNICTDLTFHNGVRETAKLQGTITSSDVYVFLMGYAGRARTHLGVGHGTDARFFFDDFLGLMGPVGLDEEEERMKDILLDMLVSYARTGIPKVEGVDFQPVSESGDFDYMFISSPDDLTLKRGDTLGEVEFWDSLRLYEDD